VLAVEVTEAANIRHLWTPDLNRNPDHNPFIPAP
jgi:hypothetical protein